MTVNDMRCHCHGMARNSGCALLYNMGEQAETVFQSLTFANADDRKDFDRVLSKLDAYFKPQRNVIHERAIFHQRTQGDGETVETYIRSLYELADRCDFGDKREEIIRDRLVIGTNDRELSQELQLKADLTLDMAMKMARQVEAVRASVKEQRHELTSADSVNCNFNNQKKPKKYKPINKPKNNYNQPKQQQQQQQHQGQGQRRPGHRGQGNKCKQCGYIHRSKREDACPAIGQKCNKCNNIGHFASMCYSKTKMNNNYSIHNVATEDQEDADFIGSVSVSEQCRDTPAWRVTLRIMNQPVKFKIDSGADVTVMSYATYRSLGGSQSKLKPVTSALSSPGGLVQCLGTFIADTKDRSSPDCPGS